MDTLINEKYNSIIESYEKKFLVKNRGVFEEMRDRRILDGLNGIQSGESIYNIFVQLNKISDYLLVSSSSDYNPRAVEILYEYINSRIVDIFMSDPSPTVGTFCQAYVNIRKCKNEEEYKVQLIGYAELKGLKIRKEMKEIDGLLYSFKYLQLSLKYKDFLKIVDKLLDYNYYLVANKNLANEVYERRWKKKEKQNILLFCGLAVLVVVFYTALLFLFDYFLIALFVIVAIALCIGLVRALFFIILEKVT